MSSTPDTRPAYTAGLRALADLLDANPSISLPYHGTTAKLAIFTHSRDELVELARLLPGKWEKRYDDDDVPYDFELHGELGGLSLMIYGDREQVCERVVVGTEVVVIPERPAVEAQPERVEEREIVEWRCAPLLADEQVSA